MPHARRAGQPAPPGRTLATWASPTRSRSRLRRAG